MEQSFSNQFLQRHKKEGVTEGIHGQIDGINTETQCQMAHSLGFIAKSKHRIATTEGRNVARCATRETIHDNTMELHSLSGHHCFFGEKFRHSRILRERYVDVGCHSIQIIEFCLACHGRHNVDSLNWIVAISSLTAQHDSISATVNSIGNVGHFRTRGTWVANHALKHLRSHDNGLMGADAGCNYAALNARDVFLRHFNTQIATSHHHAVGYFQNFFYIVYALLVLNFGDDFNIALLLFEYLANFQDVFFRTHKAVGDEINVVVDGKEYVVAVLLRQSGQVDTHARHIDTLARSQRGFVLHGTSHTISVLFCNAQSEVTIVNQDLRTHSHIPHKFGVAYADALLRGLLPRQSSNLHCFASFECDGGVTNRCAHFRSFRIHQQSDVAGNLAHIINYALHAFRPLVSRVQAHYVHAFIIEFLYQRYVATCVTNGSNNLGLLVFHLPYLVFSETNLIF